MYMKDILKSTGMIDCKPLATPISVARTPVLFDKPYDNPTQYRSLAGAMQYLTVTRPDVSFAVK